MREITPAPAPTPGGASWPGAHVITEIAHVYLRMGAGGHWEIDRTTVDAYPLFGYDDGVRNDECSCSDRAGCERARRAADGVDPPTARELRELIGAALQSHDPITTQPGTSAIPLWVPPGPDTHYLEECSDVSLQLGADRRWRIPGGVVPGEELPGYDHGPGNDECPCGDEPACEQALAAARRVPLPDLRELYRLLGEALDREAGYEAGLDAALPLFCDGCLRRISRGPVHVDEWGRRDCGQGVHGPHPLTTPAKETS